MSKNAIIDALFKRELQSLHFGDGEAGWQELAAQLEALQQKKRNKKRVLLLLILLLTGTGLIDYGIWKEGQKKGITVASVGKSISNWSTTRQWSSAPAVKTGDTVIPTLSDSGEYPTYTRHSAKESSTKQDPMSFESRQDKRSSGPGVITRIETAIPEVDEMTLQPDVSAAGQQTARLAFAATAVRQPVKLEIPPSTVPESPQPGKRKMEIELAAGMDVLLKNKSGGKYGQALFNIPMNTHTSLVAGVGIAHHRLTENYRVSEKQNTSNRETDARLQALTMVQFPILYQQKLPNTRFTARAGITPIYIIDADVVNVPGNFVGVVIPYRRFTLKDLNRFNVLFTAGVQYRFLPKWTVEIKGNYGLTELVKNSYINQSRVNDNFKAIQMGVSVRF
jgi:hypothetical protein